MPIREEVPKAPRLRGDPVVHDASLADMARAAFEQGADAVGQSGADVKHPLNTVLSRQAMMGRASNFVLASESQFGPIEVFGAQRPFPGSKQISAVLKFPGVTGNYVRAEEPNLLPSGLANMAVVNGWATYTQSLLDAYVDDESVYIGGSQFGYLQGHFRLDPTENTTGRWQTVSAFRQDWDCSHWQGRTLQYGIWVTNMTDPDIDQPDLVFKVSGWQYQNTTTLVFVDGAEVSIAPGETKWVSLEWNADASINGFDAWLQGPLTPLAQGLKAGTRFRAFGAQVFAPASVAKPTHRTPSTRIRERIYFKAVIRQDSYDSAATGREYLYSQYVNNTNGGPLALSPTGTSDGTPAARVDIIEGNPASGTTGGNHNEAGNSNGPDGFDVLEWDINNSGQTILKMNDVDLGTLNIPPSGAVGGPDLPEWFYLIGSLYTGTYPFKGEIAEMEMREGDSTGPIVWQFDPIQIYGGEEVKGGLTWESGTGHRFTIFGDAWEDDALSIIDVPINPFPDFEGLISGFKFDGINEQYITTPETNQADADTAHLFQGPGRWQSQVLDAAPEMYGGFATRSDLSGTNNVTTTTTEGVAVAQTSQYTHGIKFQVPSLTGGKLYRAYTRVDYFDSGGASLGSDTTTDQFVEEGRVGEWLEMVQTFITPAGCAWIRPRFYIRLATSQGSGLLGEDVLTAEYYCRQGATRGFTPSFRHNKRYYDEFVIRYEGGTGGGGTGVCRPVVMAGTWSTQINPSVGSGSVGAVWVDDGGTPGNGYHILNDFADLQDDPSITWGFLADLDDDDLGTAKDIRVFKDGIADTGTPNTGAALNSFQVDRAGFSPQFGGPTWGEKFIGTIFEWRRYDGVDNTAPMVFELRGKDVQEVGVLPQGYQWTGRDGRKYTAIRGITMNYEVAP